jgi:hypothetical protein
MVQQWENVKAYLEHDGDIYNSVDNMTCGSSMSTDASSSHLKKSASSRNVLSQKTVPSFNSVFHAHGPASEDIVLTVVTAPIHDPVFTSCPVVAHPVVCEEFDINFALDLTLTKYRFVKTGVDRDETPACPKENSDKQIASDSTAFNSKVVYDNMEIDLAIHDISCEQVMLRCQFRWLQHIADQPFPENFDKFFDRITAWSGGLRIHTEILTDLVIEVWKTIPDTLRMARKESLVIPVCEMVGTVFKVALEKPGGKDTLQDCYAEFFEIVVAEALSCVKTMLS